MDAAPSPLNTSPRWSIHTARSTQGSSSGKLSRAFSWNPGRNKAAGSRRSQPPSLQTLPCSPRIARPWLAFPHHPWLRETARQSNEMKTDALTRPGFPTSLHPQGLAALWYALLSFSKQRPFTPRGDQGSPTQPKALPQQDAIQVWISNQTHPRLLFLPLL